MAVVPCSPLCSGLCVFETIQIAMGVAKGNLTLAVPLHYTRSLECLVIMPAVPTAIPTKLILLAWSVTEVCRYPMYLFPSSTAARVLRCLAPVRAGAARPLRAT